MKRANRECLADISRNHYTKSNKMPCLRQTKSENCSIIPTDSGKSRTTSTERQKRKKSVFKGLHIPPFDANVNYHKSYWTLYCKNEDLMNQIRKAIQETTKMKERLDRIDKSNKSQEEKERKRHYRRLACEIDRLYSCPYSGCEKTYGSEGSLNLHMKIKHNGGNKTEREKIAKSIALAKIQGQEVPNCNLNLPPGATESALRNLQNMKNDPKLASILSLKEDSSCSSLEDSQE
mmetsp:Transcript_34151/g.38795  ORF Transcript_34151/g.38795 Transcript_34151/m.38795 type:complete len:234 (-) Transcript_34151:2-703(-)